MILLVFSFLCTVALLLPSGGGGLLAVPLAVVLMLLAKMKIRSLKSFSGIDVKTLGGALLLDLFMLLYFIINCYRRYEDLDITVAAGAGLLLFLLSLPFMLYVVSAKKELPQIKKKAPLSSDDKSLPRMFSLVTGFTTIILLSQSSPLYPINNWSDANVFFTIGRSQLRGIMVYRDVFDHKGPLLFMIHSLAALITPHSFFGMFVIQVILCAASHRALLKIADLFGCPMKVTFFLSVPTVFLIYSTNAYFYGDSAEELILPFAVFGIYIFMKAFRKNKAPSGKETAFLGIGAAYAFWIKFTLCGFWIGALLFLIIWLIKKRAFSELKRCALAFIIPCLIISGVIIIYCAATSTLRDMITVYFYNNIFGYQSLEGGIPIPAKIPYSMILTFMKLDSNCVLTSLIASAVLYLARLRDKRYLAFYLTALAFTCFFVFFGDSQMFYYIFAAAPFALPGVIPWIHLINRACEAIPKARISNVILTLALFAFCAYGFSVSCATFEIFNSTRQVPSYIFASYMEDPKNASILNYDFPDAGFYTAAGAVPTEKYYCAYNLDSVLSEPRECRESAVREGRVEYIVTMNNMYDFENYELIASADLTEVDFNNNVGTDTYFLYRRIG